tara:strand:+ start:5377 stop:5601 length:225 start_codon:yes stop_codon:yes gene_type:complete
MKITDDLVLPTTGTTMNTEEYAVNVLTGALSVGLETDGELVSNNVIDIPSKLIVPANSRLTFALNGDTATITRL